MKFPVLIRLAGVDYPVNTLEEIAQIPNNKGQFDDFMLALPTLATTLYEGYAVVAAAIEREAEREYANRPWWAFWRTRRHIHKGLLASARITLTGVTADDYHDDDEDSCGQCPSCLSRKPGSMIQ